MGRSGEKLAAKHLEARGFDVLERSYRTRRGEIDLIAFDGSTLVFVQVKTHQVPALREQNWRSPLEYLPARQMARYRWVAEAWLHDPRHASPAAERMRFDVIGVLVDAHGALVALQHVEGSE